MTGRLGALALLAALAAASATPAVLAAQDERPRGKIDEVERNARSGEDDDEGDHWWAFEIAGDVFKAIFGTPKAPGQGYLPYPYGGNGARESFVLQNVQGGRRFNSLTFGRFDDASTTLRATTFAYEGANDLLYYTLDFARYREPKPTEVDRLSDFRAAIGVAAPAGRIGFLPIALGGRVLCLDSGHCASGGDFQVGARLFPVRPLGVSASLRVGGMDWSNGSSFFLTESNAALSIFVDQLEVSAGWHWLKLGRASAFAGPAIVARLWI